MSEGTVPKNAPMRSSAEQGQILAPLALLLALMSAIGLAVAGSLFSAARKISSDESEFRKLFDEQIILSQQLNLISENNFEIAILLDRIVSIYQRAVGQSLDLAASTPLWERQLPIPQPENVFAAFHSALPVVSMSLNRLARMNSELEGRLPSLLRPRLKTLNLPESICLMFKKGHTNIKRASLSIHSASTDCTLHAEQSVLGLPLFRFFSNLEPLARHFSGSPGLTLIDIHNNAVLNTSPQSSAESIFKDSPFAQKRLVLTHALFCRFQSGLASQADCPDLRSREHGSLPEDHLPSFFSNWTIAVEDSNGEI
ncbi:hypothetical protein EBR21_05340 [bacterium]|nr:hypothetical protein [bacterium]